MLPEDTDLVSFDEWALEAEPRLRHALTALFGYQAGKEATADALAFAWGNWERIATKPNPLGYVYGVGRNMARRATSRHRILFLEVPEERLPHVEPGLPAAVASLSENQRVAVTLLYGYEWTMSEVAELMGTAKTTVQNHAERGMARLRKNLGVEL